MCPGWAWGRDDRELKRCAFLDDADSNRAATGKPLP